MSNSGGDNPDNVILFPLNRIKNKENVGVKDTKFSKRVEKEQTEKFVESAVDDIALKMLHMFVDLAMKTHKPIFTKDFAFLVDVMRSTIKRDFGLNHVVQKMVDKSVTVSTNQNGEQVARINYESFGYKPKNKNPLSEDANDELNSGGVEFTPDFDPDHDWE